MAHAWRNFKNIFPRPLFNIIWLLADDMFVKIDFFFKNVRSSNHSKVSLIFWKKPNMSCCYFSGLNFVGISCGAASRVSQNALRQL